MLFYWGNGYNECTKDVTLRLNGLRCNFEGTYICHDIREREHGCN